MWLYFISDFILYNTTFNVVDDNRFQDLGG